MGLGVSLNLHGCSLGRRYDSCHPLSHPQSMASGETSNLRTPSAHQKVFSGSGEKPFLRLTGPDPEVAWMREEARGGLRSDPFRYPRSVGPMFARSKCVFCQKKGGGWVTGKR